MSGTRLSVWLIAVFVSVGVQAGLLFAQPGPQGKGFGSGKDAAHRADMELFHFLLDHRKEITRKVTNLPNGIETLTESDNPKVVEKLRAARRFDVQAGPGEAAHPCP